MTTERKLEDIASNLDDMSTTIEEIKDQIPSAPIDTAKLDSLQLEMSRTADLIEESLEAPKPAGTPDTPAVSRRDT